MAGPRQFRRLAMGLATLLGKKPQGYFIPYRHAWELPRAGNLPPYEDLKPLFDTRTEASFNLISYMNEIREDIDNIGENNPPQPRWDQVWFPRLDAAAAYAMVRRECPSRIIEVGSGHSTRFMARAINDGRLDTRLTSIDPEPRAVIQGLAIDIVRKTLHAAEPDIFLGLGAGDVLFIDSSHILMPGSDVDHLLNRILPGLPAGVLVHFHDIFLPGDYPADWAWRGYNEQQGVAALIQGGAYEIVFSSRYMMTYHPECLAGTPLSAMPLGDGAFETSLWLKKTA
ncbi:MAG: class I SAM-dependent methyltransferase [Rhodospirillales bacterium]|jgi:predicted O-methyltransferase YrrM|nr:methyltransferase [Rhodospirillaceae bacterium]MDP6426406.1 class I SAM-dependent methyltransferase [Rhodospirillales bacterium]MDP6645753.1 class I SAM-dependent methyltransferase [Rhodospirillales bacterium]MDP6840327.1 class I SAM-dependent methyltransferase [Rhodospirillales bacterium]